MEKVLRTQISDIKLEAIIYKQAFHMVKRSNRVNGIMAQIKNLHKHSTYEIFFIIDGSLTFVTEERKTEYSSSVLIIPPYYNHYTVSNVDNGYCLYFSFSQSQKNSLNGLFSALSERIASDVCALPIDNNIKFYLHRLAEQVDSSTSDENAYHLISLIFSSLFENINVSPASLAESKSEKGGKYIHMIDSYLAEAQYRKVSLDELAKALFLCPKQVSRIIKKEYGCSLSELINRQRLSVACMLLKQTNLTIAQIASTVGYEYENYFFTVFKKAYGISPSHYRSNAE